MEEKNKSMEAAVAIVIDFLTFSHLVMA